MTTPEKPQPMFETVSVTGADEMTTAVLLKNGDTVQVKVADIEDYLIANWEKIETRKRARLGLPRTKESVD